MKNRLTISEYYEEDHDRLNDLFKRFQKMKLVDFNLACDFFNQFKLDLQRHMRWEEDILFPFLQEKSGMSLAHPVYLMKLEHRQIGMLVERIHNLVCEGDPNSGTEEQNLLSFLAKHNSKEERFLYPVVDQIVTQEDLKFIFNRMENQPVEKDQVRCEQTEGVV